MQGGQVSIMGCSSYTSAKNGTTYYSVDVYDSNSGELYRCEAQPEIFNKVQNVQKPATVKQVVYDIGKQYSGQSRIELVGWS